MKARVVIVTKHSLISLLDELENKTVKLQELIDKTQQKKSVKDSIVDILTKPIWSSK